METFLIIIGKTNTGYSTHCPDVPGCAATGPTVEETVHRMKNALKLHLEGLAEDGEPLPLPKGIDSYRQVLRGEDASDYLLAHVQIDTKAFAAANPS